MNRRELFQTVAATVAGAGVTGANISAISAEPKPALFVLEHSGALSHEVIERLSRAFDESMTGTAFQGVRCVVLTEGLRMTVLDASGRVLNERVVEDL
jgi:serine phosphatase RsbU (regulator of sigma subunit)